MTQLRVLFIDDNPDSVGPAKRGLEQASYRCACVNFPGFEDAIADFQPHITVIDRMKGDAPTHENLGKCVFEGIWTHRFCPVVIYTAFPDDERDERESHVLVRVVKKGQKLDEFNRAVQELTPDAQALATAEQHVASQFSVALRDISPYVAETYAQPKDRLDAVVRHGRRRIAALMDEETMGKLASWEQYIYPPVSGSLMLGDVIRQRAGRSDDPGAFRVILTPSCDLVSVGGRRPKVAYVLVAKCVAPTESRRKVLDKFQTDRPDKQADILQTTMLSQGYYQNNMPFPELKGRIPAMSADMRKLELIPVSDISVAANGEAVYVRLASLDSPFRELVSWVYMQTGCRPGLPDRDLDAWSKEILDAGGT